MSHSSLVQQVAPCECKGDTRYVHLNCLQKWHTTTSENKVSASMFSLLGFRLGRTLSSQFLMRQCCLG